MAGKSLYERVGGNFAIAAVVDHFSDAILKNKKIVKANPELKEWHTETYKARLPGLKFMRTLWVCTITGGPFEYTGKPLREAHRDLHVSPETFDEVAGELSKSLDHFKVPKREKDEILAAFAKQKPDVTAGAVVARSR